MSSLNSRPVLPEPDRRAPGAPTALGGIRILDFTRLLAGPFGTMLLSDLGADVVKIENPQTGDDSRGLKPPAIAGESSVFVWANRNKRSVALDLRLPQAQQVARDLAAQADVVVENYSAGVMERFGLSYRRLSKDNPRLIYCAVSAFGRDGAFASRPGYDPVVQAETGFLSLNGYPDQDPVRAGSSVIDISCGMMTCNAILGALMARERHGIGQYVEVTLFDDAIIMTGQYGMNYLMTGHDQGRFGNGSKTAEPTGLYQAKDGPLYVTCANDRNFQRLVGDVLKRPEIAEDKDFASNEARMRDAVRLRAVLQECFATESRQVWLERGHDAGVPIGLVRTIREAYNSPEIQARRLLSQLPHPSGETVPNVAPPFRFAGTPLVDPVAAPLLGQHTDEVLLAVPGYDETRLAQLEQQGVFGSRRGPR